MQVTVHSAKTNLSKLLEAAHAGEDVVIAKGKTPYARLVPIRPKSFRIGALKGKVTATEIDFLEPLPEDELELWEG